MSTPVIVLPHNPRWVSDFELESRRVLEALGSNALEAHHIGSTAIPRAIAKPIIDILVAVAQIEPVDQQNHHMESIGYEPLGEYGIPERRYFRRRDASGTRTHHVHVFPVHSPQVDRHLAFRDFMNAHPTWALAYSKLKRELVAKYPESMEDYHSGKNDFIAQVDQLAAAWKRGG